MLFMVIERFPDGKMDAIAERFRQHGRMLPDDVLYRASWIEESGHRCFQVMETPHRNLLGEWMARWNDLVDFEVVPVLASDEYWKSR